MSQKDLDFEIDLESLNFEGEEEEDNSSNVPTQQTEVISMLMEELRNLKGKVERQDQVVNQVQEEKLRKLQEAKREKYESVLNKFDDDTPEFKTSKNVVLSALSVFTENELGALATNIDEKFKQLKDKLEDLEKKTNVAITKADGLFTDGIFRNSVRKVLQDATKNPAINERYIEFVEEGFSKLYKKSTDFKLEVDKLMERPDIKLKEKHTALAKLTLKKLSADKKSTKPPIVTESKPPKQTKKQPEPVETNSEEEDVEEFSVERLSPEEKAAYEKKLRESLGLK